MRYFVRQIINGGRVCAFNQYYKSQVSDDILQNKSEELNVEENFYDFIETYLNYKNKHFKIIEKIYENQFNDYRDNKVDEKKTISMKNSVHFLFTD